jgi:hypothetical protein
MQFDQNFKGIKKINPITLQNMISVLKSHAFSQRREAHIVIVYGSANDLLTLPSHEQKSIQYCTEPNLRVWKEYRTHPVRLFAIRTSSKAEINMYHRPALAVLQNEEKFAETISNINIFFSS